MEIIGPKKVVDEEIYSFVGCNSWNMPQKYSYWFLAKDKDVLCAAAAWRYDGKKTNNKEFSYLGPCYVKEDCRNQGLQKKLIKERLDFAKYLDIKKVYSATVQTNEISKNNLIKLGFKEVSREEYPYDLLFLERNVTYFAKYL